MALITEDGSNVPNSNSYLSVADADSYHALYGSSDWAGNITADKEAALIKATRSIDLLYGQRFISIPQWSNQSLLWPRQTCVINRIQVIQSASIPRQLKEAVAEAALMYINGEELYPTPNLDQFVSKQTLKVGDIDVSKDYSIPPKVEQFQNFNKVELILTPFLRKPGGSFTMSL
jgi:hypothetical protein